MEVRLLPREAERDLDFLAFFASSEELLEDDPTRAAAGAATTGSSVADVSVVASAGVASRLFFGADEAVAAASAVGLPVVMSAYCGTLADPLPRDATRGRDMIETHTNLLLVLLVALAGLDAIFGSLGLGDGLLDGDEPAIALGRVLSLEGVLVSGDLQGECKTAVLDKVGSVSLSNVS
jgi:hypothetical protein